MNNPPESHSPDDRSRATRAGRRPVTVAAATVALLLAGCGNDGVPTSQYSELVSEEIRLREAIAKAERVNRSKLADIQSEIRYIGNLDASLQAASEEIEPLLDELLSLQSETKVVNEEFAEYRSKQIIP